MSGWNPINSPENPVAEPVTLSAKDAAVLNGIYRMPTSPIGIALDDLATGRTVVIRKWTEAQCREAFCREFGDWPGYEDVRKESLWMRELAAWLACARALGAIVEDGK